MKYLIIFLLFVTPLFADTLKSEGALKKKLKNEGFYMKGQRKKVYLDKVGKDWVVTDGKKVIRSAESEK